VEKAENRANTVHIMTTESPLSLFQPRHNNSHTNEYIQSPCHTGQEMKNVR